MNVFGPPPSANIPQGLSINGLFGSRVKTTTSQPSAHGSRAAAAGDQRRRRVSSTGPGGATSSHSPTSVMPPPLSIPSRSQPLDSQQTHPSHQKQTNLQIALVHLLLFSSNTNSLFVLYSETHCSSTQQYFPGRSVASY